MLTRQVHTPHEPLCWGDDSHPALSLRLSFVRCICIMEGHRRGCRDHWDHFGCVSGPFQVTSSPGTKAKTDTSRGLTLQVGACAAGELPNDMCCHSKAAFSPRLSPHLRLSRLSLLACTSFIHPSSFIPSSSNLIVFSLYSTEMYINV